MTTPSSNTFVVNLMRPVFQRAALTMVASSEPKAVERALQGAALIPETAWTGRFEPERYDYVVEEVARNSGKIRKMDTRHHLYLLLRGATFWGEGSVVIQPWLQKQTGLMVLDLTRDWIDALERIYNNDEDGAETE